MWQIIGETSNLATVKWPEYDESALVVDEIEIVLQINGRIRDKIKISPDLTRDEMVELAVSNDKIKELTEGKQIIKCIAVPKKLINVVVK